jgi:hypothetical protein
MLDVGVYMLQYAHMMRPEGDAPRKMSAYGELNGQGVDVNDVLTMEYEDSGGLPFLAAMTTSFRNSGSDTIFIYPCI